MRFLSYSQVCVKKGKDFLYTNGNSCILPPVKINKDVAHISQINSEEISDLDLCSYI